MADIPCMFSPPMVRSLLAGTKTLTRRLATSPLAKCVLGDRLWVRERTLVSSVASDLAHIEIQFDADARTAVVPFPAARMKQVPVAGKRLSMGCYREASRLTLVVSDVRFQPLQDISEEDARAEGCTPYSSAVALRRPFIPAMAGTYCASYAELWDSLHGHKLGETWADNPKVVALTFTVHHNNVSAFPASAAA